MPGLIEACASASLATMHRIISGTYSMGYSGRWVEQSSNQLALSRGKFSPSTMGMQPGGISLRGIQHEGLGCSCGTPILGVQW